MERGRLAFCIFLAACGVWLLQSCGEKGMEREPNAACDRVRLAEYECKEDCGNPLCGRWRWVETTAPLPEPYNRKTPESAGDCELYFFHHDGRWAHVKKGKVDKSGSYTSGSGLRTRRDGSVESVDSIVFTYSNPTGQVASTLYYRQNAGRMRMFPPSPPLCLGCEETVWEK